MKLASKFTALAAIICVLLLVGIYTLGALLGSIEFDHTLTVQAPITKAFQNLASHELKPKIYRDISAKNSEILPYMAGNTSRVCYGDSKQLCFTEEIIEIDSPSQLKIRTTTSRFVTTTSIHFTPSYLRTQLHIKEEIQGMTALDRSLLLLFRRPYIKQRIKFYDVIKSAIESTPDYDIKPEELK